MRRLQQEVGIFRAFDEGLHQLRKLGGLPKELSAPRLMDTPSIAISARVCKRRCTGYKNEIPLKRRGRFSMTKKEMKPWEPKGQEKGRPYLLLVNPTTGKIVGRKYTDLTQK